MKKFFFIAASAALALSSCSNEEVVNESVADNGLVPVSFDPYLSTRAADTDALLADGLMTRGFGVFAYEQGTLPFYQYYPTALAPNFMNDEKVTNDGSGWTYAPVKYWSNNVGAKASFFAYAPYQSSTSVKHLGNASSTTSPRLVLHARYNGPAIYYKVPENLAEAIDLCWGEFDATNHTAAIDQAKPSVSSRIKFNFKHALARVGFNAQLWVDEVRPDMDHVTEESNAPTNTLEYIDDHTTITITSLKLIGNMASEGTLRLYDGVWDAQTSTTKTIEAANYFKDATPNVGKYVLDGTETGEQWLFGDPADYIMTIPGGSFKVQIEYEVFTDYDGNGKVDLNDSKVTVKQLSDETFSLQAGQSLQIHMNIGMTSAKFTATVSDWATTDQEEVDLPANFPLDVKLADAAVVVKDIAASAPAGPNEDGDLYLDTDDNTLYRYSAIDAGSWVPVLPANCPKWVTEDKNDFYECNKATGKYGASAVTATQSASSLSAAKKQATDTNKNEYYDVAGTLYWIQVKE